MATLEPAPKKKPSGRMSFQAMKDFFLIGTHTDGNVGKRKRSLSHWDTFKTVSWRKDAQMDWDQHTSIVLQEHWCRQIQHECMSWFIPALTGICTATSGAFIEKNVEWFGAYRLGYCPSNFFYTTPENCPDWVAYEEHTWKGYALFVAFSSLFATISATLTWAFAPLSRGSGIPEIKTVLGGFTFPEVLAGNTLVIKIIGLSLSVGAGLSCGKEGPLVHIACCWSNFLAKFVTRYRENEAKQRELLSAACAAGVAVAFGAPLGGVLFSLEEASTIFPTRTMLRAFFAASIAAVTLAWWNPTGSGKLTMFNMPYADPPEFVEYPIFILLGLVGGCIGASFVHYNIRVSKARAPGTPFRRRCHIILEVFLIAFCTGLTSYSLLWTRVLSNTTIRALFHDCHDMTVDRHDWMLDLCDGSMPKLSMQLCIMIAITGFLRQVQMIFTFGTGCAAGLFIPSLLVGACLGRITGIAVYNFNEVYHFARVVKPGMYAMLGAAGVLGGVCRVTISLVVIMFELTGGLQLIVPFMIVCTLAKWVGDYFTIGIYDYIIIIRKYPFLHEPDEVTYSTKAKDLMDEAIACIHPECASDGASKGLVGTLGSLKTFFQNAKYGGYPLTQSSKDATFLGYVHSDVMTKFIDKQMSNQFVTEQTPVAFKQYLPPEVKSAIGENGLKKVLDLSSIVDETVMTAVPETPAVQLQSIFRNLGVKIIVIRSKAHLVGLITKKSFIDHLEELHHTDHKNPQVKGQLQEALLSK